MARSPVSETREWHYRAAARRSVWQVFSCGHGITSNGEGLIVDNHAHNNGGDGIVLAGVDQARGNLVRGNAGAGIESFFHGSTVSGGNTIINKTISANGVGLILYVGDGYG